jgi:hypothetical protein
LKGMKKMLELEQFGLQLNSMKADFDEMRASL